MTPEQLREAAAVMLAAADGEQVQLFIGSNWVDNYDPSWQWASCEYRIKPKEQKVKVQLVYNESYDRIEANILNNVMNAPDRWKPCSDVVEIEVKWR